MPRYAALITPARIQDRMYPVEFRTFQMLAVSGSLGDFCGAQWRIYRCGITAIRLEFAPFARDIRAIHRGYTDGGLPCANDPVGAARVAGIPNSTGRKVAIRIDPNAVRVGSFSHCPMPETEIFLGTNSHWPLVRPDMRIPFIDGKLAISGGHPVLGVENGIGHEVADQMAHSYYPKMIVRHAFGEAAPPHFAEDAFIDAPYHRHGRAGGSRPHFPHGVL